MKRYLLFPNYGFEWEPIPTQNLLCGSPNRIAYINPNTNATTFLWEQLEPNPITNPVIILPNNTSKNITVLVPNSIISIVKLRVTLNSDTNNYKYVYINPLLIDYLTLVSKGNVTGSHNNTLNDPVPLVLAPIPSLGPQVIKYTSSSQLTGVRFKRQTYRLGYTEGVTLNSSTYIPFTNNLYYNNPETRVQLNINTNFTLLKDWINVPVFSQEILPINTIINMAYPTFIADEYISVSKGGVSASFNRSPYTILNYNQLDEFNMPFTKGGVSASFSRVPYLVASYQQTEDITTFSKGTITATFTRTPYTSNIVG